jgi:hypothetical protein
MAAGTPVFHHSNAPGPIIAGDTGKKPPRLEGCGSNTPLTSNLNAIHGETIVLMQRKQLPTLVAAAAVSIGILFQAAASHAQVKPLAVVTLGGYDALIQDIDFIGSLAGQQGASQQIEMMISMFTQNKGLAGLDKTRPLGLLVLADGDAIQGALCIPVTDLDELLSVLAGIGVQAEDQGDGLHKISAAGQQFYARVQGQWALLAPMPQMLANLPDDPGTYFAPLASEYELAIRAFVQNIPEQGRQMAIMQLRQSVETSLKQLPGEEDQAYQLRKKVATTQIEQLTHMIEELEELTFGIQIDGDQQQVRVDLAISGVEGSALAKQIGQYNETKTNYAGFSQPDAAMMLSMASKITKDEIDQFNQMFGSIKQQIYGAIDQEAELANEQAKDLLKSAIDDLLGALQATVGAGMMDGGAVLNLEAETISFVAGGFVQDPAKVESGLKKLAEVANEQKAEAPTIEWNAAQHGDLTFHTILIPVPKQEPVSRQLFGESLNLAVAIGDKSFYFALGNDCVDQIKKIVDLSKADLGKAARPMEMSIALGQLMAMAAKYAEEGDRDQLAALAGMLASETKGQDHIRLVAQPMANGLRYRLEIEKGVLQAMGMAAKSAQSGGAGF